MTPRVGIPTASGNPGGNGVARSTEYNYFAQVISALSWSRIEVATRRIMFKDATNGWAKASFSFLVVTAAVLANIPGLGLETSLAKKHELLWSKDLLWSPSSGLGTKGDLPHITRAAGLEYGFSALQREKKLLGCSGNTLS